MVGRFKEGKAVIFLFGIHKFCFSTCYEELRVCLFSLKQNGNSEKKLEVTFYVGKPTYVAPSFPQFNSHGFFFFFLMKSSWKQAEELSIYSFFCPLLYYFSLKINILFLFHFLLLSKQDKQILDIFELKYFCCLVFENYFYLTSLCPLF